MADLIKIKGGKGETPKLTNRELGYNEDEKALYIGTENGNVRLCGADDISGIQALITDINTRLEALEKPSE